MMRKLMGVAFGAGLIALSVSAKAATLLATWVDPLETISWEQSTNPTPIESDDFSTEVPVFDSMPSGITSITYFSGGSAGGFDVSIGNLMTTGAQLYSGTEADPVFAPGSFTLQDNKAPGGGTLTFSLVGTAIPEPSTWAMLLVGFSGFSLVGWRARRRNLAAAA